MKYWVVFLSLTALLFLPFPKTGERGAFNTWSGLAWCKDYSACLHEVAHALDKDAGWISQTDEFSNALQMYLLTGARNDDNVIILLAVAIQPPDGEEPIKKELYAWLFELSNGEMEKMPVALRDFYNWKLAKRYTNMIEGKGFYLWRH